MTVNRTRQTISQTLHQIENSNKNGCGKEGKVCDRVCEEETWSYVTVEGILYLDNPQAEKSDD